MADEPADIGLDWRPLSVDDMKLVMDQADALSAEFPERPGVERIFSSITSAAVNAMYARDASLDLVGRVRIDEAGAFDQPIEDIDVAMAHVMRLVEDKSLNPAVRQLWNGILRRLASEVRRRQTR